MYLTSGLILCKKKTVPLLYEALPLIISHALALSLALDDINIHGVQIVLSLWALVYTAQLETSQGISLSLAAASLLHAKCGCKASSEGSATMEFVKCSLFDPRGIVSLCRSLPFDHHLWAWPLFIKDYIM
jgi:hypothetical protein